MFLSKFQRDLIDRDIKQKRSKGLKPERLSPEFRAFISEKEELIIYKAEAIITILHLLR